MNYTEEEIRKAFRSGMVKGRHQSYFDAPLDEDEFVVELKKTKSEKLTYVGTNEYGKEVWVKM